ncbi:hypothetical protein ACFO1B_33725 [Dactylosporangium siamense]|uniref:Uncharacterized protein n=1 Tax=Dactylosporangium siamense TaxID=685454 RepID=A0A919U996_9ACTN|nr:hypothetical protein [Dactylosporangium siamense]GIG42433.1 hypothetical protein Dsi01nite_004740 [Dactylosporangium siamense]
MSSLILAGVVTAGAVVLFTGLAFLERRRFAARRRAAAARLPEVELDPFHALAVAAGWPGWTTGDTRPAGAAAVALAVRKAAALAATDRPNLLREYRTRLPPHPALAGLAADQELISKSAGQDGGRAGL